MKLGMPILFEYDNIFDNIKLAEDLGFDFVELNLNFDYCRRDFENKEKNLNLIKSSKLEYTLHFYDEADFATYDEVSNAYLKLLRKYLKLSRKLNIKLLNVHLNLGPIVTISGIKNYIYEREYNLYIKRLIKNLKKVEKICKAYNVTLVLENTKTPDISIKTYLDLKEAGFNFNYDIGHDYVSGSKLKEMFSKNDFSIKEFHYHDSTKTKDHLVLGEGEIDLKYFKDMINDQYVVLELKSSNDLRESIKQFKNM